MSHVRVVLLTITILLPSAMFAQQSPQRDQGALNVATQAFNALGGVVPVDSRATGNFNRTIGASEDSGDIEILTRSFNQTSEKLTNSAATTQTVYSRGYASQWNADGVKHFALEKALASSSILAPLVVLAPAIQDPNSTVLFIATETVNGVLTNHIQICGSSPDQNFADIASFGMKDVWIANDSGLPVQVAVQVFDGVGAPAVPVSAVFSNYQSISGVLYPFQVQVSSNGTPSMTITIKSAVLAVGLTDLDFPLE